MRRRHILLLAVLSGSFLALLFSLFDPAQLQQALQQAIGVTAAQDPGQLPGIGLALLAAFVIGASMVVTPCLLPVVFTFVPASRDAASRAEVVPRLVAYSLGMVASSAVIGLTVGFLGGQVVGFLEGFAPLAKQLAVGVFSFMGAVFLLWGLRAFHVIELPNTRLYDRLTNRIEAAGVGETGESFLYGAAVGTALGVSCPIPTYHAVLLWTALVGSPLYGLLLLTALGVGRILPLWALVALPRDRVAPLLERVTENPERMHAVNGFVVTLLGTFLLVFWIGVTYLGLL